MAYVHYAGSGKKKLTYEACCTALGEEKKELVSLHGIRWRERPRPSHRTLRGSAHTGTLEHLQGELSFLC